MNDDFNKINETLLNGGIAVVRTDTIYGIIALARIEEAVERVYKAKHRDPSKQCIILISDAQQLNAYSEIVQNYSRAEQPPTSVIIPATTEPKWLLRGGSTIAYRVVRDDFLKKVVDKVGPVIAPSANPEGLEPARNIDEAKQYFGNIVDCYVDGGEVPLQNKASRIVEIHDNGIERIVRE